MSPAQHDTILSHITDVLGDGWIDPRFRCPHGERTDACDRCVHADDDTIDKQAVARAEAAAAAVPPPPDLMTDRRHRGR